MANDHERSRLRRVLGEDNKLQRPPSLRSASLDIKRKEKEGPGGGGVTYICVLKRKKHTHFSHEVVISSQIFGGLKWILFC